MDTDGLLHVAREIIAKVPLCMAITVDRNGDAHARVVQVKPLSDAWTVRFATDLRSRKAQQIQRNSRLTLAYQYDPGNAYVSLIGHAIINNDVPAKKANWRPESYRWHPGGPMIRTWCTSISPLIVSKSGVPRTASSQIRSKAFGPRSWCAMPRAGVSTRPFRNRRLVDAGRDVWSM